jgi:hypothetical protein
MSTWTSWFGFRAPATPNTVQEVIVYNAPPKRSYRDALLAKPALVDCPGIEGGYVLVSAVVATEEKTQDPPSK